MWRKEILPRRRLVVTAGHNESRMVLVLARAARPSQRLSTHRKLAPLMGVSNPFVKSSLRSSAAGKAPHRADGLVERRPGRRRR
jgi:hypothetical protein